MSRLQHPIVAAAVITSLLATASVPAQSQPPRSSKAATMPARTTLVGAWAGTATVPLPDSVLVVPVLYTFTQTAGMVGGVAMVPGQGTGPISNVVREGVRVQFRVTAPEGKLLEHDGKFGADGAIEGMVNLDKQPIAKFRITPRGGAPPR